MRNLLGNWEEPADANGSSCLSNMNRQNCDIELPLKDDLPACICLLTMEYGGYHIGLTLSTHLIARGSQRDKMNFPEEKQIILLFI